MDNARHLRLKRGRRAAEMPRLTGVGVANRRRSFLSLMVVLTAMLFQGEAANAMEATRLRRELEDERGFRDLMPILDGESYDADEKEDSSDDDGGSRTAIVGASVGAALAIVTMCLTWKACVECCTATNRRSRHRAFIERSSGGWRCELCYHTNELSQTGCVLCGTKAEGCVESAVKSFVEPLTYICRGILDLVATELQMVQTRREDACASAVSAPRPEASRSSGSNYLLVPSPRAAWIRSMSAFRRGDLTDRQLVARSRHQWKRCIGGQQLRWVYIPFEALQKNESLRSVIIYERDFQEAQVPAPARMSVSSVIFSDSSGQQLSWLTPSTAFVRDESHSGSRKVRWRLAEEFVTSSRQYSKAIVRTSSLPFFEKAQWFYQYSLKLCASIVEGFHTIRIHRDRVLKQSMTLFLSAPSATLHRRLRVDFMNEAGVDGGGILREWLHLVCSQIFVEEPGLFTLTSSSAHQGYWIKRTAAARCTKQLQMYVFVGKLLGKALLEGLLLNVRLSIPLLKHILGAPLILSDLYLLDETVYSSMLWILENDNTNALGLNFTVEGAELIPSGADVSLHDGNKQLYVAKVAQYYLFDSVREEISSIMEGLRSVISDTMLHVFDFKELDLMLSGLPQIDVNDWKQHTDVRFFERSTHEFELIDWFWEILESFSQDQRGRLLQYVTGSSGVPVEGFKGLNGMDGEIQPFTIQLGKYVSTEYTVLPHASTCLNRLDLPLYRSKTELERMLSMIIEMDVTGFSSR